MVQESNIVSRKNIVIEFTNERIIPASGLAVVGAILGKSDFVKQLNRMDVTKNRSQHQIKNGDILLTYIGQLCMGKPDFHSVCEFSDDPEFYKLALGITRAIPSEETLRQRMDGIGSSLRKEILDANVAMLKANGIVPSRMPNGYVPVDIDVTPFDNSKSKKQGVSRTYKGYDGYAPIMAYIGTEGYLINCELREGKQHCLNVTVPREGKTVYIGSTWRDVTYSGSDHQKYTIGIRAGYEIIERSIDKHGQYLMPFDLEINTWWTNLGLSDTDIINLYHAHGECEQFHSEIKSDMDVERLPSGKFDTNELVLELTILAYNILRMIGQESPGMKDHPVKRNVRRRRLRTVIGNLVMMASHVTEHARRIMIGLGQSNVWRFAFSRIYTSFADFAL